MVFLLILYALMIGFAHGVISWWVEVIAGAEPAMTLACFVSDRNEDRVD